MKDSSGAMSVKQTADKGPVGTALGMLTGGLAGLLAGPVGVAVGFAVGGAAGLVFDLAQLGIDTGFLDEVLKALSPGKTAVLAEVQETWTTPVDTRLGKLGGLVFRRLRSEVVEDQLARESAAFATEMKQLREELAQSTAETRRGWFELAAGGTLFLDEIGELTPAVQAKLLRVLQERPYQRVGGTTTLEADIRLIAATNRDLERAVADGRFREDLYYRVAVFRIHLPALRERGEDVLLLADHFVRELGAKMERQRPRFSGEVRELLLAHSWPGNVRELQNAIERALILAEGALISAEHLGIGSRAPADATIPALTTPPTEDASTMLTIAAREERLIVEVLQRTHGHKARAARLLGLTRFQLYGRLKRYHIEVDRPLGAEQG